MDASLKLQFLDIFFLMWTSSLHLIVKTKIFEAIRILVWSPEEEIETRKKEMLELFKVLEEQLGNKPYFGDDTFGFVDVAPVPFYNVFYALETVANFKIEDSNPKIVEWGKRCSSRESVASSLPTGKKLYEFALELKKSGVE